MGILAVQIIAHVSSLEVLQLRTALASFQVKSLDPSEAGPLLGFRV